MTEQNYIFGYGSLIESESRLRTTPNAKDVYPVIVSGLKRGWFARTGGNSLSTTFLGCIKDSKSIVNGVIYKVSEEEIKNIDSREKGYSRELLDKDKIKFLFDIKDPNIKIWTYLNEFDNFKELKNNFPNKKFPIVQSYVDMCINGCLEIEAKFDKAKELNFTKMFIESTEHWNEFWANDRIYPRRAFIYRPNANTIDTYLKDNLKDESLFNKIYIE
ncbi:gamma-glutamylcyclotransferase family protein [Aquimarina sp. AU58]|uniref:gamma-glutamylcyclotransferase family protein n=1 Tax=Aquimarina sp. AU58 TaxID=1874112 RepID=UPI000D64D264|nr:gamma-glutamylcyclotransferase family protein [Aquimarina sp. AU58]